MSTLLLLHLFHCYYTTIRILPQFIQDFKKTFFAEHSMIAVSIKIKNYLQPLLPNAKLAFLFLSWDIIFDSINPCFFATPLIVAPGTESNSFKAFFSFAHVLPAFVLTFFVVFHFTHAKTSQTFKFNPSYKNGNFFWLWF